MKNKDLLISETGIDPDNWKRLNHCNAGIYTLIQFATEWRKFQNVCEQYRGIGLGIREKELYGNQAPYVLACQAFNLMSCDDFQAVLGISYGGTIKTQADNQMRKLLDEQLPLVFLVPPSVLKPPNMRDGLTKQEMLWLMHNRDAPETHFVVGAYETTARPLLNLLAHFN